MKVLVLEDDPSIATLLRYQLEARGHEVFVCIGILEGQSCCGKMLTFWDENGRAVEVDLCQFDLAFVDGNLQGSVLGTELVDPLKQVGVVSIANTNNDSLVREFARRGADFVCEKTKIVGWVKEYLQDAIALRVTRFAQAS